MSEQPAFGFFLCAGTFSDKLDGTKPRRPPEWYATRPEAERAEQRFRHRYGGDAVSTVTSIVPAAQFAASKKRSRR